MFEKIAYLKDSLTWLIMLSNLFSINFCPLASINIFADGHSISTLCNIFFAICLERRTSHSEKIVNKDTIFNTFSSII